MSQERLILDEWPESHPRWHELMQLIEAQGQASWVRFSADFHRSSHLLVAHDGRELLGFLRFVTQEIGPDKNRPSVTFDGIPLIEAKILAFAVVGPHRRRGVGRAFQERALREAKKLGCYQVRSHSAGSNEANHQLKLSLGFAVHPIVRGDDDRGVYFVMPLQTEAGPRAE